MDWSITLTRSREAAEVRHQHRGLFSLISCLEYVYVSSRGSNHQIVLEKMKKKYRPPKTGNQEYHQSKDSGQSPLCPEGDRQHIDRDACGFLY
ncbi:hypothetical protein GDO81_018984 [Engystomops pustulosus]|uniref:Uncharacterized protein n=1 Tax=Engystomops pustulosus TaxID=76066 RepID=A0AAV6YKW3_ENGPU|nr:hypothetical protein GDO81_018984 [Engystomops pustulosus]